MLEERGLKPQKCYIAVGRQAGTGVDRIQRVLPTLYPVQYSHKVPLSRAAKEQGRRRCEKRNTWIHNENITLHHSSSTRSVLSRPGNQISAVNEILRLAKTAQRPATTLPTEAHDSCTKVRPSTPAAEITDRVARKLRAAAGYVSLG